MALTKSGRTTYTHGRLSAAGGMSIRRSIVAAPATAVSVAVSGITTDDTLETIVGLRLSGILVKSVIPITGSTIKAAGTVLLGSAPGTANIPLYIDWVKNE